MEYVSECVNQKGFGGVLPEEWLLELLAARDCSNNNAEKREQIFKLPSHSLGRTPKKREWEYDDDDCYILLAPYWTPNVPRSLTESRGTQIPKQKKEVSHLVGENI